MIASDRAWLVIKSSMEGYIPRSTEKCIFQWSIQNFGNTPARIIETQCRYERVYKVHLSNLPDEPNYPKPIELKGFLLPPGYPVTYMTFLVSAETSEVIDEMDPTSIDVMKIGTYYLRAYGYVKYLDVSGAERESRFCEFYSWPLAGDIYTGFRNLLGIPATYTEHT